MRHLIEMPDVAECAVRECAFNREGGCHARAITVGDGIHAACDTFIHSKSPAEPREEPAGVGACKVSGCRFNHGFACGATEIRVGYHGDHPDCLTYRKR
jgi:hypothetical protein